MENLLTPDEVVNILKIPRSWLYGHVHAGTLPFKFCKIGHYLRFPESAVREYIDGTTRMQGKGASIIEIPGSKKRRGQ